MPIRSLSELWYDGRASKREFARDYAGDFEPAAAPHLSDWDQADMHWVEFNARVLGCSELNRYPSQQRLAKCEDICQLILWAMVAEPMSMCPECKRGANINALARLIPPDILKLVDEHLAGTPMPQGLPGLDEVVAASVADAYPDAPPENLAKAAAGLFEYAQVAAHHNHVTRLLARAVSQLVAADLVREAIEEAAADESGDDTAPDIVAEY